MNLTLKILLLTVLLTITLIESGCHPSPRDLTVVTGKAVYGNLALEDVHIELSKQRKSGWKHYSDTRSGYHGSFRVHLPPGTYRITAGTNIRSGDNKKALYGRLVIKVVEKGERRMDRILIEMVEE